MKKIFLLISAFVLLGLSSVKAQKTRPKKILKTENNKRNQCLMPIFEIQDASDICDSLKLSVDLIQIKRLLHDLKDNLEWFELYSKDCSCLEKHEGEFFLYMPDDDISRALEMKDISQIKKSIIEISSDIDFIWLLSSDCN